MVQLPPPIPARPGYVEQGVASWYGNPYHGRRTSNGEIYDMDQLTAAHLRLPFGARVRVTNLENGRSVDVRINDRGPFVKKRIIDLSREAAYRIGMLANGTARVQVAVLSGPDEPLPELGPEVFAVPGCVSEDYFGVQVGAFSDLDNAERMRGKMTLDYAPARIYSGTFDGKTVYRVVAGEFHSTDDANALLGRLEADRFDGFVRSVATQTASHCLETSD